jgi:hypothetical protein
MNVVVETPDIVSAYELRLRLGAAAEVEAHARTDECEVRIAIGSEDALPALVADVQEWLRASPLPSVWLRHGDRRVELTP